MIVPVNTKSWNIVIGLEVHVQLNTASKLFSISPNQYNEKQNYNVTHYDFGLPGELPILNKEAVSKAILFGLAVQGTINRDCYFERKNYFYPDLPKGYQISQNDNPIVQGGSLTIEDGTHISLVRAHLEEDAGKLVHEGSVSKIDLNRAGAPLLEIVTEPVITSSKQASDFLKTLHSLVKELGITDGKMELGQMRCDVNISIREYGHMPLGTRVEIKNLNSFRFVTEAIEVEYERQVNCKNEDQAIVQETRLYNSEEKCTKPMRSKEMAQDYRYFPDPDIPSLAIDQQWIDAIAKNLPVTAETKKKNIAFLKLSQDDEHFFVYTNKAYEYLVALPQESQSLAVPYIRGELARFLNQHHNEFDLLDPSQPITPSLLNEILIAQRAQKITTTQARDIISRALAQESAGIAIALAAAIEQATSTHQEAASLDLEKIINSLFDQFPKQTDQLKSGKDKLSGFFVGKALAHTKGKADPGALAETVKKLITLR